MADQGIFFFRTLTSFNCPAIPQKTQPLPTTGPKTTHRFFRGTHFYFTLDWRDLEERVGVSGIPDRQFLWGLRYIDGLLARDRGTERLYAMQDANWNVTAIVSVSVGTVERYSYRSYGTPLFMSASFAATPASAYDWETLFAGYRFDVESSLTIVRERRLHPALGLWTTRDPLEFLDGPNRYEYVQSNPLKFVDPTGTITGQCRAALNIPFRRDPVLQFLNFGLGPLSGFACFGASITLNCMPTGFPLFRELAPGGCDQVKAFLLNPQTIATVRFLFGKALTCSIVEDCPAGDQCCEIGSIHIAFSSAFSLPVPLDLLFGKLGIAIDASNCEMYLPVKCSFSFAAWYGYCCAAPPPPPGFPVDPFLPTAN